MDVDQFLVCAWDFLERIWRGEKAADGMLGVTNTKEWTEEAKFKENKTKLRGGGGPEGLCTQTRGAE